MKRKIINSQMNNYQTYLMYLRQCRSLAENVFKYNNLPNYIDVAYINKILVNNGSIAWFKDDILGIIALPWVRQGGLDVYGRPTTIRVLGSNGYSRELKIVQVFKDVSKQGSEGGSGESAMLALKALKYCSYFCLLQKFL